MEKSRNLVQLRSEDLAHLEALLPDDAPEVWRDFASCCFLGLLKHPHTQHLLAQELAQVAFEQLQVLTLNMGGQQPYITGGSCLSKKKRDQEICQDFNGRNAKEVAKKHNIGASQFYKIIRKIQKSKHKTNLPSTQA